MADILLIKNEAGMLVPATDEAISQIERLKVGETYAAKVTHKKNGKYFRRWFRLMRYAFDVFEKENPGVIHKGELITPDFERFRDDIVIMSGFSKTVMNALGELRQIAESVSPDNMNEARFEQLYNVSLSVLIEKVFKAQSKPVEQINAEVSRLLIFS